ncbi:MAG: hypothetical protein WBW06_00910 [Xanthobacteraceae bacterium]
MTADDLSAPLGQGAKRRRRFPGMVKRALPLTIGGVLASFLGVFLLWAMLSDDPLGGEPMAAVPIDLHAAMAPKKSTPPSPAEASA